MLSSSMIATTAPNTNLMLEVSVAHVVCEKTDLSEILLLALNLLSQNLQAFWKLSSPPSEGARKAAGHTCQWCQVSHEYARAIAPKGIIGRMHGIVSLSPRVACAIWLQQV